VKFWDASAIVPLVVTGTTRRVVQTLAAKDAGMLVWWAIDVECASAIARMEREGALDGARGERSVPALDAARHGVARSRSERLDSGDGCSLPASTSAARRRRTPAGGGVHCG